jgi:hypothetical protein
LGAGVGVFLFFYILETVRPSIFVQGGMVVRSVEIGLFIMYIVIACILWGKRFHPILIEFVALVS